MKRQIHAFSGFGDIGVAGHNIKLGRGGIREIEFFVQTQQLIAGGRQPDLRIPQTLERWQARRRAAGSSREVRGRSDEAYVFLRRIEHRLQMVADEQTQTLPEDAERPRALRALLRAIADTAALSRRADRATARPCSATMRRCSRTCPELTARRRQHGVRRRGRRSRRPSRRWRRWASQRPSEVIATVRGWHHGRYPAVRTPRARELLTEVQPLLIEALAETADPDRAFASFDRFLAELPSGVQLFSLLRANPSLLRLVADIMGTAPRLARILARRRRVLDAVLDPGFFGTLPDARRCSTRLVDREIGEASDLQDALDRARVVGSEQAFLIGVRVLSGTIRRQPGGRRLCAARRAADRGAAARASRPRWRARTARCRAAAPVIAMGKLGGREMTAASDLDLIVVYDFDAGASRSRTARGRWRRASTTRASRSG